MGPTIKRVSSKPNPILIDVADKGGESITGIIFGARPRLSAGTPGRETREDLGEGGIEDRWGGAIGGRGAVEVEMRERERERDTGETELEPASAGECIEARGARRTRGGRRIRARILQSWRCPRGE
jgi:hypothetical protein